MQPNVQKRRAQPKRSIANPGDDHELGLWANSDQIRKPPESARGISSTNRYMELAELAVPSKPKKKAKSAAAE
jgi:hypothetical protein